MPDPEQRRQYAVTLAEELQQYERPMPVMDNCMRPGKYMVDGSGQPGIGYFVILAA
jgi:hypothetical protein